MKYTEEKGRGLYAAKAFNAGDVLFREKPFVLSILPSSLTPNVPKKGYCHYCLASLNDVGYQQVEGSLSEVQ